MIDQVELEQSLQAGFSSPWHVHERYVIEGGWVRGEGAIKSTYFPALQKELPNVIAKINENKPDELIEFVSTYGLLGIAGSTLDTPKEPLQLVKAHISTVRLLMDLAECHQYANDKQAASWLDSIRVSRIEGMGGNADLNVPRIVFAEGDSIIETYPVFEESALKTATDTLIRVLDGNVRGITRHPIRTPENKIKSYFSFNAMYQMVYWHIFNAVESGPLGQGELRRCEACGAPFISTDKRQRFCPKLYKAKQSRCAVAARVRELRSRKNRA